MPLLGSCVVCGREFSYYPSNRSGRYCSQLCTRRDPQWLAKQAAAKVGRKWSEEARHQKSEQRRGKPKPPEHGAKVAAALRGREAPWAKGANNWNWKGGVTVATRGIRTSNEYRRWRLAVLERDRYRCIECAALEQLEVDHIEPFAIVVAEATVCNRPEWIYDVDNGRTLCKPCHVKTPTYRKKSSYWPEVKLIEALREAWQNTDQSEPFQRFYERWMEKRINSIKEELS